MWWYDKANYYIDWVSMQVYIAPLRLRTYLPQEAVVGDAGGGDEGADEEGERQHEGQDERVGAGRAARP